MSSATPLSLLAIALLITCLNAQYSDPIQVGPSTNPLPVTSASIDAMTTLAQNMYNRWYALDQACDPRAVFAVAYLYMTANAKRLITNLYFDDGNNMANFIHVFASRYISAYDNWASGNLSGVSQPWQIAFSFALGNHSDVTQDMTLGFNAHINYDLAIATYESGYAVPQWAPDYYRVNDLMNQIDANVTHALGRYDASFLDTDFLSEAYFTGSVQLVTSWRTSAYATAVAYQTATIVPLPIDGETVAALEVASEATAVLATVPLTIPYPYNTQPARYAYCMTQNQQPIGISD